MPQAVLELLERLIDFSAPINFNGEDMTVGELLSSPAGLWFSLIVVGVPLVLLGCFIWQGRKNRRYADRINRDKRENLKAKTG